MPLDQALPQEAGYSGSASVTALQQRLADCRQLSLKLTEPLSDEDQVVQSMDDASPTKWHLAHTTWFFEELLLKPHMQDYRLFDDRFSYCFNSYYDTVGPRQPRPKRGLLTRPSLHEVRSYRDYVDEALGLFLDERGEDLANDIIGIIETGISHEQQHQELLLADILNMFSCGPLRPAYLDRRDDRSGALAIDLEWVSFDGGLFDVGHDGEGFAYDNEGPVHQQFLRPFKLANRCVTNEEWISFIDDGGYESVGLWLSDGWAQVQTGGWNAPLYWEKLDGAWHQMTLRGGVTQVDLSAPVSHVSYFEADAFARWAGKRLPREFEWEVASTGLSISGNFVGARNFVPVRAAQGGAGLTQMFGDLWEWTQSAYSPYPGYRPPSGTIGEYNGKFMCNQFVLKGGSCATPDGHVRRTYRNFFYPHQRWQFMGLRLADDC